MQEQALGQGLGDMRASRDLRDAVGTFDPATAASSPGDQPVDAADPAPARQQPLRREAPVGATMPGRAALAAADAGVTREVATHAVEPPEPGVLVARIPASVAVAVGQVVVIDPDRPGMVRPASVAADRTAVGVAITAAEAGSDVPVAVSGVVACQVDAGYGAIVPGDLLVSSFSAGRAALGFEPAPGTVVGKALGSLPAGTGNVPVLLMPR
jgi:hypothetical protein